jgi:hypothetical protein
MRLFCLLTLSALCLVPEAGDGQARPAKKAPEMSGIAVGYFAGINYNLPKGPEDFSGIARLGQQLGHVPAIAHGYWSWKLPDGSYRPFPMNFVDYLAKLNIMPMVNWEPAQCGAKNSVEGPGLTVQPEFSLAAITSGKHDAYIRASAKTIKASPHTVYIRLMHELNGNWYPWGYGVNGNTSPAQFVEAFRHVVRIFQQEKVANVQFVWCVSTQAMLKANAPPIEAFFPGDEYVDWVSIDGYNRNRGMWRTVDNLFAAAYATATKISRRPVMIAETACVEDEKDPTAKPRWITDGFLNVIPNQMPRVKAILYFNNAGHGYTYRLDSSPQSFAAFKAVVASPLCQAVAPNRPFKF